MARRGRPKKSGQVTYDSKETKFFMAVICFALGIFALLSYVVLQDSGIFGVLRSLFGDATIMLSLFLLNFSFSLFGINFFFTTKKSLISQFLFLFAISTFIATNADPNPEIARQQAADAGFGGVVGFQIASFLQDNLLLNLTGIVSFVLSVLILPSIFNQNIAEFFNSIFNFIGRIIDWLRGTKEEVPQEMLPEEPKTAMVGDLSLKSRLFGSKQEQQSDTPAAQSAPDFVGISNQQHRPQIDSGEDSEVNIVSSERKNTVSDELKYPGWKLPPISLLNGIPDLKIPKEDVENNSTIIEQTLASFGIESKVMEVQVGPSVTQYALDIALGIKVSKIANLRNDLALALATSANAVRIEVPIPGTSYVGIEVPNKKRRPVFFREIVDDAEMNDKDNTLPVVVGRGIAGNPVVANIQDMPHLLIAGATGSGKSVLTTSFITSILMKRTPDEVKFIMVDPKQVELSDFNGIPHLLTPVIVEMDKVSNALKWAAAEMDQRYTIFREAAVKDLKGYNKSRGFAALPYIVIVIDEMADMMLTAGRAEIEANIVRLAQKARATGIHLLLATQRPSVNVITGIIKANIPGRIGMSVTTGIDSRVILDINGAESLLGKGDMLFKEPDKNKPMRVQGVLITQEEIQRVVKFIKDQTEEVEYIEDVVASHDTAGGNGGKDSGAVGGDSLFEDAVKIVVASQKGSSSLLQRKLAIGYNRAAKLLDELEAAGVVGVANGSKPRDVLIADAEGFLAQMRG